MTRVLVTGATGFVGRQILRELLEKRVYTRVIARSGSAPVIDKEQSHIEVVITKNLFDESYDWWLKQCEDIDTIFHLAWYTEPGKYQLSSENINCLIGSLNIAKAAVTAGVKRFVGVGTCFEYDLSAAVLSVETPLRPRTPYADAKAALYLMLSHYLPLNEVDFVWCRLFYLHGENEDTRRLVPYINSMMKRGEPVELRGSDQIRDYLDVRAAGCQIVNIAFSSVVGPVNICSGVPITIRQIAEKIADKYGRRDLLRFGNTLNDSAEPRCVIGIKT